MAHDRSQATRVTVNKPSLIRLIKSSLQDLIGHIEGEEWEEANKSLMDFTKFVQMRIGMTGQDTKELHDDINWLGVIIRDPYDSWGGYIGTMKRASCREKLDVIVKMLAGFGVYIGQTLILEEKTQENLLGLLHQFNDILDTLSVQFVEQDIGKEELLGVLKQLRQAASTYPISDNNLILLQRRLLRSINDTLAAMNAVNVEQPGKLTFKDFAYASANMQYMLNDFLLALDDPRYRQQALQDIADHEDDSDCTKTKEVPPPTPDAESPTNNRDPTA